MSELGQKARKTGQKSFGTSRARVRSFVPMSQGHVGTVDVGHGTESRDRTSLRPEGYVTSRPSGKQKWQAQKKSAAPEGAGTWMHVAALNLLQDHEQGIPVNPTKLAAARKLLGKEEA